MGRPPIGKLAMTGAERTRLYRLKLGKVDPVTKPVTKPADARWSGNWWRPGHASPGLRRPAQRRPPRSPH